MTNWIESHKFTSAIIVVLIMWISLFSWFWVQGDAIKKDPCSICAERMGEEVTCRVGTTVINSKTFYPDGNISTEKPNSSPQIPQLKRIGGRK